MQPLPWHPADAVRPEAASLMNRLLRRRGPLKAGGMSVTVCPAPAQSDGADTIPLRLGGIPAMLDVPGGLLDAVLAALDPAAPGAEPEIRRLLLELAFEDAFLALDHLLPAEVLPFAEEPAPGGVTLGLRCAHPRGTFTVRLRVQPDTAVRLAGLLDRVPAAPWLPEALRIPVHLRLGCCTLALAELRGLRPGDVLMPERGRPDAVVAVAGERLVWQAEWTADSKAGAARVGTPRNTAAAAGAEEWTMGEQVPAAADAALEELPVRLLFEVGRTELTVAELAAVAPGHVFTVPGGPPGRVDILANGRRIGQGEMVRLGDGTGVRLLSLVGQAPGPGR